MKASVEKDVLQYKERMAGRTYRSSMASAMPSWQAKTIALAYLL